MKFIEIISGEHQLPHWKKQWYQLFAIATIFVLAGNIDTKPSQADTIPEPVPIPWLGELECADYFKILTQAQLNVFGDTEVVAAFADDTFTLEDGVIADPDQPTVTEASQDGSLSWILPEMNRQESEHIRFPLQYNPGETSRTVTIVLDNEVITYKVKGTLMVTSDSGIPQYDNAILLQLKNQLQLISGPKLKKLSFEDDSCSILDGHNHRSLSLGFTYGSPETALITFGEPLPITHFEIGAIDQFNSSSWEAVINSILLAAELQAQVLNISIGGNTSQDIIEKLILAMNYAKEKGVMVFVAAGNFSSSTYMPACLYDEHIFRALGLQKVSEKAELWPGSNTACEHGLENSFTAPGYMIPSTDRFGGDTLAGGTSMSAPLGSFVASLDAIDPDGQPLPLSYRIANFRKHLVPPPPFDPNSRRPDKYQRLVFNHCTDLDGPCEYSFLIPWVSQ